MGADVETLLREIDGLTADSDFGFAVGEAAQAMGLFPGMLGPCTAFAPGEARMACE